ncbi:MAG: FAD-binding oxidoreductase [Geminicoccaceae bacterium]
MPLRAFEGLLGTERVITAPDVCALHSEDIAGKAPKTVAAVIRPPNADMLARVVALAGSTGFSIHPRGGGMSYTGGYLPECSNALSLDLSDLDQVIEIDPVSRHVIVEAGCSWAKLLEALAVAGYRTPFFGPLSGITATIGGALSQNGAFFGSAAFGYAADHVLGLEIVDGTGKPHRLGAWAAGRQPSLSYFGPDLLGPFLGDCGAFGIKTKAVLPLVPSPPDPVFASFAFGAADQVLSAMQTLLDIPHLAEVWAMDRVAHRNLAATGFSVLESSSMASDIAGKSRSITETARHLLAGRRLHRAMLADLAWTLHVVIEPPVAGLASTLADAVATAAEKSGSTVIPDTIPRVTRARPFRPIKALIGPHGERWLSCHGVFPAGHARSGYRAAAEVIEAKAERMADHDIRATFLLAAVKGEILIEPQLFWPDALTLFQKTRSPTQQAEPYLEAAPQPEARQLAIDLRRCLGEAMAAAGGSHLQIGHHYRYIDDLPDGWKHMLRTLKRLFDPDGILNPGVLGLSTEDASKSGSRA